MGSIGLAAAAGLVVTFGTSGLLKLRDMTASLHDVVALVELAVVIGLLFGATRLVSFIVAGALAVAFTGYAATSNGRPCRCFGRHFETQGRKRNILRAVTVLALAAIGAIAAARGSSAPFSLTALTIGATAGTATVLVPWFISLPTERSDDVFRVMDRV